MRLAAAGLLVLLIAGTTPAAAAPSVVYRFADARIDEASGIGVGVRSPGVDYVQNDSGDSARFFAVDASTGRTAATVTVPGAANVDWEDLAVAPAPAGSEAAGRSSVWLADIGDNDAVRSEIRVYRVDEPRIAADDGDRTVRSSRPDVWRLRYPDGPTNAESLAVTPTGTAYLVTKSPLGGSVVYRLPTRPDPARVQTLVRVGAITFRAHAAAGPFGAVGTLTATGAAVSPDGSLLAVRTYSDAYLWRVRANDVAAALRQTPTRVALPVQQQGEGVAFDGGRLLVDSEGVRAPVDAVPLPAALTRPPASGAASSSTSPAAASTSTSTSASAAVSGSGDAGSAAWAWVAVGVGAVVVLAAVTVTARRHRAR